MPIGQVYGFLPFLIADRIVATLGKGRGNNNMPTRYPLDERSGRSASTRVRRALCEALEQRRLLASSVTVANEPDPLATAVTWDAASNTAKCTIESCLHNILQDGNYRASISAEDVTNAAGEELAADGQLGVLYGFMVEAMAADADAPMYDSDASAGTLLSNENEQAAREELERLIDAAKEWNKESPPWARDYQCREQAGALMDHLRRTPWRYWSADIESGYTGHQRRIGYHHVVILLPDRKDGNPLEEMVVDAFKNKGQTDPTVRVMTAREFRQKYPYRCHCPARCKHHIPARPWGFWVYVATYLDPLDLIDQSPAAK